MKRPAEKLYRIKVIIAYFERGTPSAEGIQEMTRKATNAVKPIWQKHITTVEVKRRFRV